MCVVCGNSNCANCNEKSYLPSNTSLLKFDGLSFDCPDKFSFEKGDSLNSVLNALSAQICENANTVIEDTDILEVSIPISQADMFAMNTVDKELLPPSPLFGYDVLSVVLKSIPETTDYLYNYGTGNNDVQMAVKVKGSTTTSFGEYFGLIGGFAENVNAAVGAGITFPSTNFIDSHRNPIWTTNNNHGIYLSIDDVSNYYTLGDHTFVAIVTYLKIEN